MMFSAPWETAVQHLIKSSVAVFTLQVNNDGFLSTQRLIHIAQVSRMLQILQGRISLHAYCQKQNPLLDSPSQLGCLQTAYEELIVGSEHHFMLFVR